MDRDLLQAIVVWLLSSNTGNPNICAIRLYCMMVLLFLYDVYEPEIRRLYGCNQFRCALNVKLQSLDCLIAFITLMN